jgi:hypothetical protein
MGVLRSGVYFTQYVGCLQECEAERNFGKEHQISLRVTTDITTASRTITLPTPSYHVRLPIPWSTDRRTTFKAPRTRATTRHASSFPAQTPPNGQARAVMVAWNKTKSRPGCVGLPRCTPIKVLTPLPCRNLLLPCFHH